MHAPERPRNPFVNTALGGRILSASQLPWFALLPPRGFGVLTTVGRKTGKTRRRCVRAIRQGDRVFLVAIGGPTSGWARNALAAPEVRLRIRGGRFTGPARELRDDGEREEARRVYCGSVNPFDYAECLMHRSGRPSRAKIQELHRRWFAEGLPIVVELR